jgi:hypothetical protein
MYPTTTCLLTTEHVSDMHQYRFRERKLAKLRTWSCRYGFRCSCCRHTSPVRRHGQTNIVRSSRTPKRTAQCTNVQCVRLDQPKFRSNQRRAMDVYSSRLCRGCLLRLFDHCAEEGKLTSCGQQRNDTTSIFRRDLLARAQPKTTTQCFRGPV